jgi:glutathione S-transferase
MMASVLRAIRRSDLMAPYPRSRDFYARTQARPAWQRTLGMYAERLGVNVDDIR